MLTKYEERFLAIKSSMHELGMMLVDANKIILQGLEQNNSALFGDTRLELKNVERNALEIDNKIVAVLALFNPEARDLKELVAFLKITNEFVRVASNTRSFLKNFSLDIASSFGDDLISENIIPLQKATIEGLQFCVEMLREKDSEQIYKLYTKTNIQESKSDDLCSILEKNILTKIVTNKELSKEYFEVLSSVRKLEKISDRSASISQLQYHAYAGGDFN